MLTAYFPFRSPFRRMRSIISGRLSRIPTLMIRMGHSSGRIPGGIVGRGFWIVLRLLFGRWDIRGMLFMVRNCNCMGCRTFTTVLLMVSICPFRLVFWILRSNISIISYQADRSINTGKNSESGEIIKLILYYTIRQKSQATKVL